MAAGAALVLAVPGQQLRGSVSSPSFASSSGSSGTVGGGGGMCSPSSAADDPVAALHRAGAQARRVLGQEHRHRQAGRRGRNRSASSTRTHSSAPTSRHRACRSAAPATGFTNVCSAVEEIEHRAVVAATTSTKKRTGSSNIACRSSLVKRREPLAIDAVVLLEAAEVEPVAAELGRQAADCGRRAASAGPGPSSTSGWCRSPAAARASSSSSGMLDQRK